MRNMASARVKASPIRCESAAGDLLATRDVMVVVSLRAALSAIVRRMLSSAL